MENKVFILSLTKSKYLSRKIIGAYSNKSKAWKAIERFYNDNNLVYNCMDKYPDYAWSYSSVCSAFKKYTKITVPLVGDENTELYDDEIELEIKEVPINGECE